MPHEKAIHVFEEIKARPYRLPLSENDRANNCYIKGLDLIKSLTDLNYKVTGRLCETYWDPKIFPQEILSLQPKNTINTHFFVEVYVDHTWKILDPSFQNTLAQHNLPISLWDNNQCCFPITKLYSEEESIIYQKQYASPEAKRHYFTENYAFLTAMNQWFKNKN